MQIAAIGADIGSSGLHGAEFRARWAGDWQAIGTAQDVSGILRLTWDLCQTGVPDGALTLRAVLTDEAGNSAAISPDLAIQKRFACNPAPAASVSLAPASGPPSSALHAVVTGFRPGENVSVSWEQGQETRKSKKKRKGKRRKGRTNGAAQQSPPAIIATFTTSPQGDGNVALTVPGGASSGSHQIQLTGNAGSSASASFTVVPASRTADLAVPSGGATANLSGKTEPRKQRDKHQHGKPRKERKRKHNPAAADRDQPNGREKKRGKRGERERHR